MFSSIHSGRGTKAHGKKKKKDLVDLSDSRIYVPFVKTCMKINMSVESITHAARDAGGALIEYREMPERSVCFPKADGPLCPPVGGRHLDVGNGLI